MHRRTRSGSAVQHYTLQELLQDGRITHPGGMARAHSGSTVGTPSRFKAEAQAERDQHATAAASTSASASLSRSSKGTSEDDHIVCQSKLYDAYELQDLEQHLDRELSFDHGSKTQSDSARDQGAQKPLLSAVNPLNGHRSPGDFLRDVRTRCPCKFCRASYAKTSSLSSDNSSRQPDVYRMPSLSTVSNIEIEPAEEPSVSSKRPRAAEMSAPGRPSLSMPHGFIYRGASAEQPSHLAVQEPQAHADRYPKALRAHRLRRRRSHRFPCVKSLCRSLCKKQNNLPSRNEDAFSPSTSMHGSREPWKREFHHHHTVNHYHQVHHHHHHHLDNGPHVEEIDWPLSPAHLEELS